MSKNMLPVFIDPKIQETFRKQIVGALENSSLWHTEFCPIQRLFLISGPPGSGMSHCVYTLLEQYGIPFKEWKITRDRNKTKEELDTLQKPENTPPIPVLIIRNIHTLFYYRELFATTCTLRGLLNFCFIIGISKVPLPVAENHPFWTQWEVKLTMSEPPSEFKKILFHYYLNGWAEHWKYSKVVMDYNWLTDCSTFCTSKDIRNFCHTITRYVLYSYPEQRVDITKELLENTDNLFMFKPFQRFIERLCIINYDKSEVWKEFNPSIQMNRMQEEPQQPRESSELFFQE